MEEALDLSFDRLLMMMMMMMMMMTVTVVTVEQHKRCACEGNIEARRCSRKAMGITYSECVCLQA